jgi:AraC-like DNA-binding protein
LNETAVGGQSYHERAPRPELAGLLTCVWVQAVAPAGEPYEHRSVPNGAAQITCDLDTGRVRVSGPRETPTVGLLQPGVTVVGVRFRPGALGPAAELLGGDAELDALWGRPVATLGERLGEAGSPAVAAALLEAEVLARAAPPDELVAEAIRRLQPWRRPGLARTTAELFVSPRQLRRRFAAAVGFGPKTLQRILRFQGFLALADARHDVTLARLAAEAGYADQAHLARECTRLTGLAPSVFLAEMRRSCGETHDHAASYAPLRRAIAA